MSVILEIKTIPEQFYNPKKTIPLRYEKFQTIINYFVDAWSILL